MTAVLLVLIVALFVPGVRNWLVAILGVSSSVALFFGFMIFVGFFAFLLVTIVVGIFQVS